MNDPKKKRREVYARVAVQLRSHERPILAERECPGAMGLYVFLLLQSRGEETNGDTDRWVALASWGAPTTYRKKQAAALIKAGLVVEVDGRLHVVKYDDHNDSPEVIEANREWEREKKYGQRHRGEPTPAGPVSSSPPLVCPQGTDGGTPPGRPPDVPISISYSISKSSPEGDTGEGEGPPRFFVDACDVVEQATGETINRAASWLRYSSHRQRTGKPMGKPDAQYWLTTVDVREAQQDRLRRRGPGEDPPQPPVSAKERARQSAERMKHILGEKA